VSALLERREALGYFQTHERVAKLLYVTSQWLGTPWCANSSSRGPRGGVSCHNLPRAIYLECGAVGEDFPVVRGDPNGFKHARISLMERFIDGRDEFRRVPVDGLQPGDLIGLRISHCVDHLGVVVTGLQFAHVLMHKHTALDNWHISPWRERILAAWRPVGALRTSRP
jgi:cell wall-associated NlpC family hydrolase